MARIHGEAANYTLNSIAIEDELNSIEQTIEQDVAEVTSFNDVAKEFVQGKYGWTHELGGSVDFAAAQSDATIFAMVGAVEKAVGFDPTGVTAASDDPNYDGNVFLTRHSISAQVGAGQSFRATLVGNGALARTVA